VGGKLIFGEKEAPIVELSMKI